MTEPPQMFAKPVTNSTMKPCLNAFGLQPGGGAKRVLKMGSTHQNYVQLRASNMQSTTADTVS